MTLGIGQLEIARTNDGKRAIVWRAAPWASIAAHGLILALLILGGRHLWKIHPVTARESARTTVLYWAKSSGTGTTLPEINAEKPRPIQRDHPKLKMPIPEQKPAEQPQTANSGPTMSQNSTSGTGSGDDNRTPAFPVFSPSPQLADRSLLPRTDENVVVDVNVSADGEVLDEKLIHGLGNSLDQLILDTVRNWKFHPATVDGNAVASVAELVFPLNQKWHG